MANLLEEASILLTPTAYNNGSMLAVKPDENLYGLEEIVNGDFATDSDWSKGGNWSIGGGVATANGSGNSNISQNVPLTIGTAYSVTYTVVNASLGSRIGISTNATSIQIERTENGTYTETFNASLASFYIRALWNNGNSVSIDNVSVKEDLSGDFTFSRNSAATRVNAQGLVENQMETFHKRVRKRFLMARLIMEVLIGLKMQIGQLLMVLQQVMVLAECFNQYHF